MTDFFLDYDNGLDANSGADFANAWKSITLGATAARIAPLDRVKLAKSPDPVSIGDAAWTDLSRTVTLAAALTALIDDCESGWSADGSSTVTHPTDSFKSGSAAVNITKATYATATVYAHKTITEIDLSTYTAITLPIRVDAAVADNARWVIELCSDDAATAVVDAFAVPALPAVNRWTMLRIVKTGGGALGSSIKSIRIRSGASAPTNNQDIRLDNINACNDFSLCSLISKSGAAQSTSEGWYGLKSINGTTLILDNDTESIAGAGQGYSGTTETVTTYRRETIKVPMVADAANSEVVQDSGTAAAPITFSGGWNTSSGLQDGETFLDGQGSGNSFAVTISSFITLERLSFARFACAIRGAAGFGNIIATLGTICNCGRSTSSPLSLVGANCAVTFASLNNCLGTNGAAIANGNNNRVTGGDVKNNIGVGVGGGMTKNRIRIGKCNNNSTFAASFTSFGNHFEADEIKDNGTAAFSNTIGDNVVRTGALTQATEFSGATDFADSRLYSHNHDLSGYHRIFTDGGQIDNLATDFAAPATGSMWKLLTSATTRVAGYPLWLELPGFAVVADKLVTIKAVMKKAHATQVNGRLVLRGGRIAGVAADVVATLADNTDEQELTITFTPTEAGVVVPEVWAEYVSGHAAVYIDRISSFAQAA